MTVISPGDEFRLRAAPGQALLRRLAYLAEANPGSVLAAGEKPDDGTAADDHHNGRDKRSAALMEFLTVQEQQREEQMRVLNQQLDGLERESERELREARERLDEIRRDANRTIDGRLVFADRNGIIRDETGKPVDSKQIDRGTWHQHAPSWEDFQGATQQVAAARKFHDKVRQTKKRLNGGNLSDQDLNDLQKEIDGLEAGHKGKGSHSFTLAPEPPDRDTVPGRRSTSASKEHNPVQGIDGPQGLGGPFANAANHAPADGGQQQQPAQPQTGNAPALR